MTTLLLLLLFLITAGFMALAKTMIRHRKSLSQSGPVAARLLSILEAAGPAVFFFSVAAFAAYVFALGSGRYHFYFPLHALFIDDYDRYHRLLCEVPHAVQGTLGLLFIVMVGLVTGLLFTAQHTRRWQVATGVAILAWAGLYGFLPFHLSAPDFDDLFIVDKMLCGIGPTWDSNKPTFTLFDYLYRVADLVFPASERFLRFGINGWIFVLYELNLLMILRRFLAARARKTLGTTGAAIGACLAACSVGLFLLSHTLAYELAGATVVLTAFNLIEHLRAGRALARTRSLLLLSLCSLGIALQPLSYPQYCAIWMVVCAHAALTLYQLHARRWVTALAAALSATSAAVFLLNQYDTIATVIRDTRKAPDVVADIAPLVLAGAGAAVWIIRSGLLARWWSERQNEATTNLVLFLYGFATLGLFLLPNQLTIFPFQGGLLSFSHHWTFAENHARYGTLCYPFLALAIGWGACRLAAARLSLIAWGLMALAYFFWNTPYLVGFYFSGQDFTGLDDAGAFQRNLRPILALDRALERVADAGIFQRNLRPILALDRALERVADVPLLYLPIPRDHGDHYLIRAVRPAAAVTSVCDPEWRPKNGGRLVLSRNTLFVGLGEFKRIGVAARPPLRGPFRGLDDIGWEIQVFDGREIDPAAVKSWCRAVEAAWGWQRERVSTRSE